MISYRMLQKREDEIRCRREHVEKLLKWHQRLDVEEQEVMKMEQMIMFISTSDVYQSSTSHEQINDTLAITVQRETNCHRNDNSVHERSLANISNSITMERTRFEHKKKKQIHKIEQSLNTLKMVSSHSISSDFGGSNVNDDVVKIYGCQLNKLWKRLTGQIKEKYTPDKVYSLGKSDLELMYEQAKSVVLLQFHANEEEFKRRLIDNSMSIIDGSQNNNVSTSRIADATNGNKSEQEIVPTLDLNLASSPEPKENIISDTDQGYYFSNSNIEQISEQKPTKTETQSVEATTLDGTSENLEGSQIQTEEQIDEDEENEEIEQSESLQEEVQSDITEDSLNESKEDVKTSEIKTASQVNESQVIGSGTSSQIPSVIETSPSTIPFELNVSNSQMIEEKSFPHIDLHSTASSVIESDLSIVSQNSVSPVKKSTPNVSSYLSEEQKYQSDDFEDGKCTDELTSISTATVTKVTTTTPTVNQSSDKTITPKTESQNELEKRLILLDNGMKELSEIISHSPILQSEADSSNESEQSRETKSPTEDDNVNIPLEENKVSDSEENSEEISEENETATESMSTENGASIAINGMPKVDSDESTDSIAVEITASKADQDPSSESQPQKIPFQYTLSASSMNKVPEADALKRTHPLENEV